MSKSSLFDDTTLKLEEKVRKKIFNFVSYKLRSAKEISDRLDRYLSKYKNVNDKQKQNVKDTLTQDLKEMKLIDDDVFAQSFVAQKLRSRKPTSKFKVKQFLIKKGIPSGIIDNALIKFTSEVEGEKILQDARKKLSSLKKLPKLQKKKKLYDYLSRKGYPFDQIRSIVDRVLEVK